MVCSLNVSLTRSTVSDDFRNNQSVLKNPKYIDNYLNIMDYIP